MRRFFTVLLPLLALSACDQPPTKEIAAAEAQIEQARQAGAERFAPDRWREAQTALATARAKVQEKDYRAALSAANDAAEKSRLAVQGVATARAHAVRAAELAQREIGIFMEEIEQARQEALVAKVPEEAFVDVEPRLAEVREGLQRVADTLAKGDVLEAQKAAAELRAQAADLPAAFRDARALWEEEHPPKGHKPAKR
jgi:HEPN domain-containing protein